MATSPGSALTLPHWLLTSIRILMNGASLAASDLRAQMESKRVHSLLDGFIIIALVIIIIVPLLAAVATAAAAEGPLHVVLVSQPSESCRQRPRRKVNIT